MFYAETNIGKRRENNEDYMIAYNLSDTCKAYVVLDGIGGASSGEVASKTAANKVVEYLKDNYVISDDIWDNSEQIKLAVKYANKCVYEMNKQNKAYKDMGTTIALLIVDGDIAYMATVGDSRIYEIKDGKLEQLSDDDTYVNALVKDGIITKEEAATHPEKHVLLKALGVTKTLELDIKRLYNIKGRRFIICSDGLYICVNEEKMVEIIKNNEKQDICSQLVSEANNNGGLDNITVMYVEI